MDLEAASTPQADHRAEQRRRILSAAVLCFSREGFHGTSMQQICTEAGMSPGALYRYFPSKEAIIGAIVEGERAEKGQMFEELERAPSLIDALTEKLAEMLSPEADPCAKLGPEIMAEAIRNPRLRSALEPVEEETRAMLRTALVRAAGRGEIDARLDPDDLVVLLQVIGDGLVLHHLLHPDWDLTGRLPAFSALVRRMVAPRDMDPDRP
ncbi:TetR/AcrR family transcriptional regulator [Aquabacter spiritensis]|uniref:TetR family transcriptional regulator n=1 Tax=Aquabacter spiritensis TaxID=933073 RepID=A0A4R3LZ62_9HYPH|nr:TetR/AcrR family transcriptional regulator [Aquabacter spiritensis]TCT05169.1 TetR family transcriptional regulator [Aquabacter spiritensis]